MATLSDKVQTLLSSITEDSKVSFEEKVNQLSRKLIEIKEKEKPQYTISPIDTIGKKIYTLLSNNSQF